MAKRSETKSEDRLNRADNLLVNNNLPIVIKTGHIFLPKNSVFEKRIFNSEVMLFLPVELA